MVDFECVVVVVVMTFNFYPIVATCSTVDRYPLRFDQIPVVAKDRGATCCSASRIAQVLGLS